MFILSQQYFVLTITQRYLLPVYEEKWGFVLSLYKLTILRRNLLSVIDLYDEKNARRK